LRYIKGDFLIDLICIVPLQALTMKNNREKLFVVIKWLRLGKGLKFFNVPKIMKYIKQYKLA